MRRDKLDGLRLARDEAWWKDRGSGPRQGDAGPWWEHAPGQDWTVRSRRGGQKGAAWTCGSNGAEFQWDVDSCRGGPSVCVRHQNRPSKTDTALRNPEWDTKKLLMALHYLYCKHRVAYRMEDPAPKGGGQRS